MYATIVLLVLFRKCIIISTEIFSYILLKFTVVTEHCLNVLLKWKLI